MSPKFSTSILLTLILTACGGGGSAGDSIIVQNGINISDYETKNVKSILSIIGNWNINMYRLKTGNPTDPVDSYNIIRLGSSQNEGIVLAGWAYDPRLINERYPYQVNIALLEQRTSGSLRLATSEYVLHSNTNGASSVIVADFNGDGRDDMFLPAYNETPALAVSSAAFISKPDGSFSKLGTNSIGSIPLLSNGGDAVIIKDSKLITYNRKPAILVTGNDSTGNSFSGIYTYNGSKFDLIRLPGIGLSVASGDFSSSGSEQFIYGGTSLSIAGAPAPYFNKAEYSSYVSEDPLNKTKQPKIWVDDINQDGILDIIVGSEINPGWRAQLQLLVNQGNNIFVDQTGKMPFNEGAGLDYSMRMIDVDNSGIKTYFLAQTDAYCEPTGCRNKTLHGNYILVNDGTGQFHIAMHSEFLNLGDQVISVIRANALSTDIMPITWTVADQEVPKFIAYRSPDGKINFMAKAVTLSNTGETVTTMVNVPLKINLTTDFKKDIVITDRNNSKNIRTFAGNDTIAGGCVGSCKIDGGLGINTVVFSGPKNSYTINRTTDGYIVSNRFGTETLKNIQILRFTDGIVQ